jgi:uncharacterized damage-inducible protein DinB
MQEKNLELNKQLAKHMRDVFFGGNWTSVNLKETTSDINWKDATKKTDQFNTIATLVFHIGYYIKAVLKVLQGGPLDAHDKYSFDLPEIKNEEEWKKLVETTLANAEELAKEIERLNDQQFSSDLADPKYGSKHRNIMGLIEHTHYHLGQIALLKKLVQA